LDYNLNLKDKRNNLQAFETLEFEYIMRSRLVNLHTIFKEGAELENVTNNLDKIIELTKPKNND